ncbi:hypothetical protein L596_015635 [Steinernema carpocapsae]|uniref:Presenilin n=1 Tax=Steinernema carpocapsae TaxID=34508 RepID=A0A4U5NGT7_STECR|nr:hypothetical protein L596_015635 [Steinernema carpocapsae]
MDLTPERSGYSWQQSWKLLRPVMINMVLTLCIWIGVYEGENDGNLFGLFLLNSKSEHTTGNDLLDGLINGMGSVVLICIVSFLILFLVMKNMKRLVILWISGSCVTVLFGVSGMLARDICEKYNVNHADLIVGVGTTIYGSLGYLVFFTSRTPLWFHQLYVITNCSIVSVFYLRMFPVYTAWFVLLFVIGWDWFAVLTPYGPLNLVQEKAADYSQDILKFLMFSAESCEQEQQNEAHLEDSSCDADIELEKSAFEDNIEQEDAATEAEPEEEPEKIEKQGEIQEEDVFPTPTAFDAFNDDRVRLGMGDFVFYGVLVGKAACSGSIVATAAAYIGVCVGLLLTLMVVFKRDDTVPALPNSIALGMLLHFGTLHLVEPCLISIGDHIIDLR